MYDNDNDLPDNNIIYYIKKKQVFDIFLVLKMLTLMCGKNVQFLE